MPVGVLQASVSRRSGAYAIDLLVVALPTALGFWLLLSFGFSPAPELGWFGVGGLAVVVLLYSLFTAALVARTGQSLGKRVLGLRVLRTATAEPATLGESALRGYYFFAGLLGAGVLPIIMLRQLRQGAEDASVWPHRAVGTQVIDVRRGPDPLSTEPVHYPAFRDEWLAPGEEAPVAALLGPAPAWSHAYKPPAAKTFPARPTHDNSTARPVSTKPSWLPGVLQSAVATAVVAALGSGMIWGVVALQPARSSPGDPRLFSAATLAKQRVPLSSYSGIGFPGFSTGPAWKHQLSTTALAVTSNTGTFIFDNRTLTILNNVDGKILAKEDLDGSVVLAQETVLGDEDGMVWQIGNTLHGWAPSMGGKPAIKADLPDGAKVSAAGSSLLIQQLDGKVSTFTKTGLVPVSVPEDRVPLGVEDGKLLSARFTGPLAISSLDGKHRSDVPLNPPAENLQIVQWVTAGHGVVVLLWSAFPDSKDPSNPVTIAVYRQGSGELLSRMEVTKSRIDEDPNWIRGNGFTSASFAGYFFDLSNGWPILDLKAQAIKRSGIVGDGVTGERQEGTIFMRQDSSWIYSGLQPLGISQGGVVVRTKDNELQRFSAG